MTQPAIRSRPGAAIRICWPTRKAARPCRSGSCRVRRYCGLAGELTPLATPAGGRPLVARVPTNRGGVYFCATTPAPGDSSLATNGVVLYVFVQRALAAGAAVLGKTRQLDAGEPPRASRPGHLAAVAGRGRRALDRVRSSRAAFTRPAIDCWP